MSETEQQLLQLISQGESLTVEFKSDANCLPDRELVLALVALANTEGGELLLGVEDSGAITGLHANHVNLTALPAMIANKTNPSIAVRVERFELEGRLIARITVPKSRQLISTSDGLLQRRRSHRHSPCPRSPDTENGIDSAGWPSRDGQSTESTDKFYAARLINFHPYLLPWSKGIVVDIFVASDWVEPRNILVSATS